MLEGVVWILWKEGLSLRLDDSMVWYVQCTEKNTQSNFKAASATYSTYVFWSYILLDIIYIYIIYVHLADIFLRVRKSHHRLLRKVCLVRGLAGWCCWYTPLVLGCSTSKYYIHMRAWWGQTCTRANLTRPHSTFNCEFGEISSGKFGSLKG